LKGAVYWRITRHTRPFICLFFIFSLVLAGRTALAQTTVRVAVDGASIWSAPSVPSIVLATVKAGTVLDVLARFGSWYRVRLPDDPTRIGYVLVRQVEGSTEGLNIPPAPQSAAQPRTPVRRRGQPRRSFLSGSAGYPSTILNFESTTSFAQFLEQGSRTTTYNTRGTPLVDIGYGVEVRRGLFAAAAISWMSGSSVADIDQQIPHPFFFERMRSLKAEATALSRDEIALHLQAAGLVPINRRVHLFFGAGPSLFRLKQSFVTDVAYTHEYPFDDVVFDKVDTAIREKTQWGGNVQLNIITMLNRHVGLDGLVRFSRASLRFTLPDESNVAVPAGGLHVALGLRAEF
jgi:hypothetical protein